MLATSLLSAWPVLLLQTLGRLAKHFIGETFPDRFSDGTMLAARYSHLLKYHVTVQVCNNKCCYWFSFMLSKHPVLQLMNPFCVKCRVRYECKFPTLICLLHVLSLRSMFSVRNMFFPCQSYVTLYPSSSGLPTFLLVSMLRLQSNQSSWPACRVKVCAASL